MRYISFIFIFFTSIGSSAEGFKEFLECPNSYFIYRFNDCGGIKKRIESKNYKVCKFKTFKREILSFLSCGNSDRVSAFNVSSISNAVEADYVVIQIKKYLKHPGTTSKEVEELQEKIYQIRKVYPTHFEH